MPESEYTEIRDWAIYKTMYSLSVLHNCLDWRPMVRVKERTCVNCHKRVPPDVELEYLKLKNKHDIYLEELWKELAKDGTLRDLENYLIERGAGIYGGSKTTYKIVRKNDD